MEIERTSADAPMTESAANGEAVAAIVAAGIGSLAVGLVVLANEVGVWAAPAIYEPAGGVSGRVAVSVAVWIVAWIALHFALRGRRIAARTAFAVTIVLVGLGILATFPPLWGLLG